MTTPIALTIAGSDSSGGAGIQADLKSFAALGVYGASVITALTAQNTRGVTGIHPVPADFVTAQIDAVFSDLAVGAVKIGMVAQLATIDAIAAGAGALAAEACRARSRDGGDLGRPAAGGGRRRGLADKAHSARLADHAEPARGGSSAGRAGRRERGRDRGPGQAAAGDGLSGGADQGRARAGRREHRLSRHGRRRHRAAAPRIATQNTHGTGCSLSSAIAAGLAKGEDMETAVRNAKAWVSAAIAAADRFAVGHGHGPIHHFHRFY